MCFLALLLEVVPDHPVVVAANRDEYYDRPGEPPGPLGPGVLAGRDPRAGGTWLGVNHRSLLAAVSNVRSSSPPPADARSRGLLCLDLLGTGGLEESADLLARRIAEQTYADFNLLAAAPAGAWLATWTEGRLRFRQLAPGLFVIGNVPPDVDDDPKVARGRVLIEPADSINGAIDNLSAVCRDHGVRDDGTDAICVHGRQAGTLSSTLIAVHASGPGALVYLHAPGPPCRTPYAPVRPV